MAQSPSVTVSPLGQVVVTPLADIRPYPGNPRKIPAKAIEQTAKSIAQFGWQQPIVVDHEGVIVAGHVRHAAALKLGLTEAPVITATLTEAQARAFRIADNRSHDYTMWDYTALLEELTGLGGDFDEVLDLADWGKLVAAFGESQGNGTRQLPLSEDDPMPRRVYPVTVEFTSQEAADLAGPDIMKLDGVVSVRHPAP